MVAVPCALIYPICSGARRALRSAARMARAAPSMDGCVMWQASALMPNPTSSAWILAPRACAASSGSSTNMAAPSPRIMPRRSFENGRQVSGDTTRMASQAFKMPKLNGASLPP